MAKTNAAAVSDHILAYAVTRGIPVTNLKLQKLLYFCYGWFLARTDEPLFDDPLQAWPKGPVQPTEWRRFKDFGKEAIAAAAVSPALDGLSASIVDEALREYAPMNEWKLVHESHDQAWRSARGDLPPEARCSRPLDPGAVKMVFADLLRERAAVMADPEDSPEEPLTFTATTGEGPSSFILPPEVTQALGACLERATPGAARRFDRDEMRARLGLSGGARG